MKIFGEETLNIRPNALERISVRILFLSIERFFKNDIFIFENAERFLDNIEEKCDKFAYTQLKEINSENNTVIYYFVCFYDNEVEYKITVTLENYMKALKNLEEMVGKTVKSVSDHYWGEFGIVFTDDTYIVLEVNVDCDGDTSIDINYEPSMITKRCIGAITGEEYEKYIDDKCNKEIKEKEQCDRKIYEELKSRFG